MKNDKPKSSKRSMFTKHSGLSEIAVRFFLDEETEEDLRTWESHWLHGDRDHPRLKTPRMLWNKHQSQLLAAFIAEHPGKRPSAWWQFEKSVRDRVGGIGDCAIPSPVVLGMPTDFVSKFEVEYFNGRARHVETGELIRLSDGSLAKDGSFTRVAIDPNDPPRYESQAAFLKRNNLFVPGEEARLTPDDFEPETVSDDIIHFYDDVA